MLTVPFYKVGCTEKHFNLDEMGNKDIIIAMGGIVSPTKGYVEVLIPRTSECHLIWR